MLIPKIGLQVITTSRLGCVIDPNRIDASKFDEISEPGELGDIYDTLPTGEFVVRLYTQDGDRWAVVDSTMVREAFPGRG